MLRSRNNNNHLNEEDEDNHDYVPTPGFDPAAPVFLVSFFIVGESFDFQFFAHSSSECLIFSRSCYIQL